MAIVRDSWTLASARATTVRGLNGAFNSQRSLTLQITAARVDFSMDSPKRTVPVDGFLQGPWHVGDRIKARQGEPQSTQNTQMACWQGQGLT